MKKLNSPFLTLTALIAFLWLGYYSLHHQHGYTASQRGAMDRLVAQTAHNKMTRQEQVEAINYLWGKP